MADCIASARLLWSEVEACMCPVTAQDLVQHRIRSLTDAKNGIRSAYVAELEALATEAAHRARQDGKELPLSSFIDLHASQLRQLHEQHQRLEEQEALLRQLLHDLEFCEC